MAYISNKDKKYLDQKEHEQKEASKNPDYKFVTKDPSKTLTWKILNIVLISLMVLVPVGGVIFLIVNALNN